MSNNLIPIDKVLNQFFIKDDKVAIVLEKDTSDETIIELFKCIADYYVNTLKLDITKLNLLPCRSTLIDRVKVETIAFRFSYNVNWFKQSDLKFYEVNKYTLIHCTDIDFNIKLSVKNTFKKLKSNKTFRTFTMHIPIKDEELIHYKPAIINAIDIMASNYKKGLSNTEYILLNSIVSSDTLNTIQNYIVSQCKKIHSDAVIVSIDSYVKKEEISLLNIKIIAVINVIYSKNTYE